MANTGAVWKQIPLFQSLTEAQGQAIEKKLQPVKKEPGALISPHILGLTNEKIVATPRACKKGGANSAR